MARNLPKLARTVLVVSPVFAASICAAPGAFAHDIRQIGDGRYSTSPRNGYLFSCRTSFNANAPGAPGSGPWLDGGTYDLDEKPTVDGAVTWPSQISITREGGLRIVRANNLPTHPTGNFPVASGDDAYRYDRNPNTIREQDILLRLPSDPQVADQASCVPMGMIGFTLTGGALYNAVDARGRDAAAYEILDSCGGHPQQNGQYHYHDDAACLPHGHEASGHSELIGYALDGFGIYGPDDVGGGELTNAGLDGCHGHIGPVVWDGEERIMYHYHMTNQYPYSIGCFRGSPVTTPTMRGGGGPALANAGPQQAGGPDRSLPPQQLRRGPGGGPAGGGDPLTAIAQDLGVDVNALRRAVGAPPPDLQHASEVLGISLADLRAAFMRHPPPR